MSYQKVHPLRNIPATSAGAVDSTDAVNIQPCPESTALPRIVAVRTGAPAGTRLSMLAVPRAVYRELDPINLTAASLYRAVVYAGASGTRMLDLGRDVFQPIAWFHDWAGEREALAAVVAAADLLERHGWLTRQRMPDGVERWTPLGRDRPRRAPRQVGTRPADGVA